MVAPIQRPPDRARGELAGWSGTGPQIRRVIARVEWTDGSWTEHKTFAHEWTHTHVRVYVETEHDLPRHIHRLWLPAAQVIPDTSTPEPGDYVPAPDVGPSAIRLVGPDACPNGHALTARNVGLGWQSCTCSACNGDGHHSWSCWTCRATIYGPPLKRDDAATS